LKSLNNILVSNYLFLDEHFCTVSRIELLRSLKKLNNNVYLYAQTLSNRDYNFPGITGLFTVKVSSNQFFKFFSFLLKTMIMVPIIVIKKKINIIILDPYSVLPLLPFIIISRLFSNKIFVIDFRSGIFHKKTTNRKNYFKNFYIKFILNKASRLFHIITFVSEGLKKHILNEYSIKSHHKLVWTSAVNDHFTSYPLSNKSKNNNLSIIYHGSLDFDRGILELCMACSKIGNITLKIIGSGVLVGKIKEICDSPNINNIILREPMPQIEIVKEISKADIGIVPLSDTLPMRTSSPLKMMEYISLNKPVIATKLDSFINTFKDNYEGIYYIENNSIEELIRGINYFISKIDIFRDKAKKGRTLIKDNFTWDIQAMKLNSLIDRVSYK